MESSACKIVGHVEYNGEALVQLGFKCLPRRTHPSGTPNSGSQLFLAISLSLCSRRGSLASSRFVVGRHIITRGLWALSRFLVTASSLFQLSWVLNRSSFVVSSSLPLSLSLFPLCYHLFLLQSSSRFAFTYDVPPLASFSRPLVWFKALSSRFLFYFFPPAVGPLLRSSLFMHTKV